MTEAPQHERTQDEAVPGSLGEALSAVGLADAEEEVLAAIQAELTRTTWSAASTPTQHSLDYLLEHSGLEDSGRLEQWTAESEDKLRAVVAAGRATATFVGTLSREEAARLLGVAPTRISHQIRDGHLHAIRRDGRPRIPRWQIHEGSTLPGLREILPAIAASGFDPVDVATVMTTPREGLAGRSPVDHLLAGGEPARIVDVIDGWARR